MKLICKIITAGLMLSNFYLSAQTWSITGGELNSHISALFVYNDKMYVGGNFTNIDGAAAYGLAEWDGNAYSDRNTTLVGGLGVSGFGVYDGKLMAVGTFYDGFYGPGFVAEWNGTALVGEEYKLNSNVYDILSVGSVYYVVGYFTEFEGTDFRHVAMFNGTSYETVGGGFNETQGDLFFYEGGIVCGGGDDGICYFNGTDWEKIGTNPPPGGTLEEFKGDLYVAGCFEDAIDGTVKYIAKWDGTEWSDVGGGLSGGYNCARAMYATSDYLYVAGQFTMAGDVPVNNIAKWDGETWSTVGDGIPGEIINNLCVYKGRLYAGPSAKEFTNHLWEFSELLLSADDKELNLPKFSVYPNPATNKTLISIDGIIPQHSIINIADISGRIIKAVEVVNSETEIDLHDISNGIYFIELIIEGNYAAGEKLIVTKN